MINRASKKLTEKWIGPYEVTQVTPNMVELRLPKTLRIHPVVNVSPSLKTLLSATLSSAVWNPAAEEGVV